MADDSDPPRKFYKLKPTEFERVNQLPPAPPSEPNAIHAVSAEASPPADVPIDVRELARIATSGTPLLGGTNAAANRDNEVHAMLRTNHAVADAAGLNAVKPVIPYRRRKRDYKWLLIGGNLFILTIHVIQMFFILQVRSLAARVPLDFAATVQLLANPMLYAICFGCMVFYSAALTWLMFGVMDDY